MNKLMENTGPESSCDKGRRRPGIAHINQTKLLCAGQISSIKSWLGHDFALGAWGLSGRRSRSSLGDRAEGGAMAGLKQEGEPLGTATWLRAWRGGGGSSPKEEGAWTRVFAGDLLPAHLTDAWIPTPCYPPYPLGARSSVCQALRRPPAVQPSPSRWRVGWGTGREGGQSGSSSKGPDLRRGKTA